VEDDWDPDAEEFLADQPDEPSEQDVREAACQLLHLYGQDATVFTSMQAEECLAAGDIALYKLNKRVLSAIDELLTFASPDGVRAS